MDKTKETSAVYNFLQLGAVFEASVVKLAGCDFMSLSYESNPKEKKKTQETSELSLLEDSEKNKTH